MSSFQSGALELFDLAIAEAESAFAKDEVPVGAVLILKNGKMIKAHNLKESEHDATAHAEILAIRKASQSNNTWRLLGAKLYVTLEPCPMCLAACQQARIEEVIFMAWDPKGGALSLGFNVPSDVSTRRSVDKPFARVF
jgi:tRNA(adenine34) deaminase